MITKTEARRVVPLPTRRSFGGPRKICLDCAKAMPATARICPECKQPQDWRRWLPGLQLLQSTLTILGAALVVGLAGSVRDLIAPPRAMLKVSHAICTPEKISFRLSKAGKNDAEITRVVVKKFTNLDQTGRSLGDESLEARSAFFDYVVANKVRSYEITPRSSKESFCDLVGKSLTGKYVTKCVFSIAAFYKDRTTGMEYEHGETCPKQTPRPHQ